MKLIICEKYKGQGDIVIKAFGLKVDFNKRCATGSVHNEDAVVTWAAGHILSEASPKEVMSGLSWMSAATTLPIPIERPHLVVKNEAHAQKAYKQISALVKKASSVVIASDPDREGEAIGWNLLQEIGFNKKTYRAAFDKSTSTKDIRTALLTTKYKDIDLSYAGFQAQIARAQSDWYYQLLTMAATDAMRRGKLNISKPIDGDRSPLSIGRVQTPVVRMIVEREEEIKNHKTKNHYTLSAIYDGQEYAYMLPKTADIDDTVVEKGKVLMMSKERLEAIKLDAVPFSVERNVVKKNDYPPNPFDLAALNAFFTRNHKWGVKKPAVVAGQLRMKGYITYVRTDESELPISMYNQQEIVPVITAAIGAHPKLKAIAGQHPKENAPKCFTKKKMTHFGIIPTDKTLDDSLTEEERLMYDVISKRFLIALCESAEYEQTTITITAQTKGYADEKPITLQASFKDYTKNGYYDYLGQEPNSAPAPKDNPKNFEKISIVAAKTAPPKRYTPASLISDMKNAHKYASNPDRAKVLKQAGGLGRASTRDTGMILDKVLERGYVKLVKGQITPLEKGIELIKATPENLKSVEITALWEAFLSEIESESDREKAEQARIAFTEKNAKFIEKMIKEYYL